MTKSPRQRRLNHATFTCNSAIVIVAPAKQLFSARVDDHVSGPTIERNDPIRIPEMLAWRNDRQVCDATDILQDTQLCPVSVIRHIQKRNEWSAFPAGSHVGGAEI